MDALEELIGISGTRENHYTKEWKDRGKKVIGYVCSYVPEEIFYAADVLPVRITGKGVGDTAKADAYLTRVNCSFARCCLESAFRGEYDFLDGVAWTNGCDHIRRCYDNWKAEAPHPFMHILPVPHTNTAEGREWYKQEVLMLKQAFEEHFGVKAAPEKLAEAVSIYNESRRLLRKLYDLRRSDEPPLSGSQTLAIMSAGCAMPKTEFNRLLNDVLEGAQTGQKGTNGKARLVIAGSEMDEPEFIENVEDLGAVVVSDTLCFGTRYFWDLTDENGDAFEALIDRYYNHVPCPRMAGDYPKRLRFLREQVARAKADGVILESIKFCDLHGTDNALLKRDLEKEGIPTLELERQYGPLADAGRIRTRVQAFLERIGG